jgi:hypothetical protein
MTPEQIVAWIKDSRGIELTPDSARRLAGLIASGRATLEALGDDSLFDAEPAQMVIALKECAG